MTDSLKVPHLIENARVHLDELTDRLSARQVLAVRFAIEMLHADLDHIERAVGQVHGGLQKHVDQMGNGNDARL